MKIEMNKHREAMLRGAFLITIAGFLVKFLSVLYRIPYQNIVGDMGFYVFQQVYPIYGIAASLATYGFPIYISNEIAKESNFIKRKRIIMDSLKNMCTFSAFVLLGGYIFAPSIANAMGDLELINPIRASFLPFLFVPFVSLGRGYFQGLQNMRPTAVTQLVEQLFRVIFLLSISMLMVYLERNTYEVATGAIIGSTIGFAASAFIFILFFIQSKQLSFPLMGKRWWIQFKSLKWVFTAILISMSAMILVLLQFVDSFTVLRLLEQSGLTENQSKIIKGIYDRGAPLVQVGTVMATSIALSIVPFLAEAKSSGKYKELIVKARLAFKINLVIGAAASIGLYLIMNSVNIMLFENSDGTEYLRIYSFSILFGALALSSSGLLQGLGYIFQPAIHVLLALLLKAGLNYLFIQTYGIKGAVFSTIISLILLCTLNIRLLTKEVGWVLEGRVLVSCIASILFMFLSVGAFVLISNNLIPPNTNNRGFAALQSLLGVGIGVYAYMLCISRLHIFSSEDLQSIPYGEKFLRLFNGGKGN